LRRAGFFGIFTGGIFSTSAEYAMKNKTLIEGVQIANNRQVILAVIRPPLQQLQQIDPALASNPPYTVITYPLPIGTPLNGARPGLPGGFDSLTRDEAMNQGVLAPGVLVQNELSQQYPDPPGGQGAEAVIPKPVMGVPVPGGTIDGRPSQPQAQRDLMATRTFGILGMADFGNPWDLRSWHKNFRTVMGMKIVDWFFPVRMSPCCNHDSGESQFALGPQVDDAKRRAGFLAPVAQVPTKVSEPAQQEKQRLHSEQNPGAQHNNNPIPPPQQLEKLDEQGKKQESTGNSCDAVRGT
jgi:palmitoyltransferase